MNRSPRTPVRQPTQPRRLPLFADPWWFRRAEPIERGAALDGRPVEGSTVKRNGRPVYIVFVTDPLVAPQPAVRPERSMLSELRRRVSAEIATYRNAGHCSDADIEVITGLWLEGKSLRSIARARCVAAAAIGDRIERLQNRCPRFYQWWVPKNMRRSEARRRFRDNE